jgi:hypothetical protein
MTRCTCPTCGSTLETSLMRPVHLKSQPCILGSLPHLQVIAE